MGLSNELSCEAGSFSHCRNLHRCFQSEVLRLYFPTLEPWIVWSALLPPGSSQFISTHSNMGPPGPPPTILPTPVLQPWSCCEYSPSSCSSPSLPPVWMNVYSLTPWLSDFYIVRFSVSSGCFLFLNLLLSFFWFCKEAQCIYLCLHHGWKLGRASYRLPTLHRPWTLISDLNPL